MASPVPSPLSGTSRFRCRAASIILLASTLAGCSFDLGSWGSDSEKPKPAVQKTENISARSVTDAQGYTTRGQGLAQSGKTEQALAEFDHALALDPYNAPAHYGRGLIYQGQNLHQ